VPCHPGVSAAGKVTARLKAQLQRRTSAVRQLISSSGDSEEQAAQGQYETRLLEQSIYRSAHYWQWDLVIRVQRVIAENIKGGGPEPDSSLARRW